jgi:glycosyltransferase involved in cell wall biosynthesis
MKLLSIVIPIFNEVDVLPELVTRLNSVISNQLDDLNVEIIMVDDGSTDGSTEVIKSLVSTYENYKLIRLSRNFGHQRAVIAGLHRASGDAVVIIDADLQDPPEVIPELVDEWLKGADVVYAVRRRRNGEKFFKKISARLFYRILNWMSETYIPPDTGDFRLVDGYVLNIVKSMKEQSLYLRGIFSWVGFNQVAVVYDRDERFAGESKYPFRKMLSLALDAILTFSEKPLRLVLRVGGAATVGSLFLLSYFLVSWLVDHRYRTPGWLSVMTVILFLGSIQTLFIGIVGIYVSRIFRETKGRPIYIVDDRENV